MGSAPPLEVTLTGDPTGEARCLLSVTPRPGSFDLHGCVPAGTQPRLAAYGAVRVGTPKTLPVRLENVGARPCTLRSVRLDPATPLLPPGPELHPRHRADQVLVDGHLARTIGPGKVGEVRVTYRPDHRQLDCGLVRIRHHRPHRPRRHLPGLPPGPGRRPRTWR